MKALGVIVNIFLPGIGTIIVGKIGQGVAQILLAIVAAFLSLTFVLAIIGVPLGIGVWIWAIVSAATSEPQPIQVNVVSHQAPPTTNFAANISRSPAVTRTYDFAKWEALTRFDPEVARAAESVRPYGDYWVHQFAQSYLALNDKSYLGRITEKIISDAKLDSEQTARMPRVVEEGMLNGRKWKRYSNGVIEGELLGGGFKQFGSLGEFQEYIS